MNRIWISLAGYLIGSVPFAFLIGRMFYHTDVRQHGSGNLGGSNTGRVLGRKAGVAVMALDLLKVTLAVHLAAIWVPDPWAPALGALFAALGHCYPVFANFRGGKAVAALYGFLFGLWVCVGYSPMTFFLPLAVFLAVLFIFRIVSLASMVSAAVSVMWLLFGGRDAASAFTAAIVTLLIIWRHRENIRRMILGTENRVRWM